MTTFTPPVDNKNGRHRLFHTVNVEEISFFEQLADVSRQSTIGG